MVAAKEKILKYDKAKQTTKIDTRLETKRQRDM